MALPFSNGVRGDGPGLAEGAQVSIKRASLYKRGRHHQDDPVRGRLTSRPAHNHKKTGEELLEEAEARQLEQHEQHQSEAAAGGCGGGGSTPSTLILKPAGITRATSIDRKSK